MIQRRRRSSNRSGRYGHKSASSDLSAIFKIVAGLAVLAALGTALVLNKTEKAAIDRATFCHKDGPNGVSVILLDASDKMDEVKVERVKAAVVQLARDLETGYRIDLFFANASDGNLSPPVFSKCNPGRPGQYAGLMSDAKKASETFETGFLQAIEDTLAELLTVKPSSSSPIIESIRSASTAALARLDDATPVEFYIVSDMVQNSNLFRQKTGREEFKDFKASRNWADSMADLHGARVHLFYLSRSHYRDLQGRAHQLWWEDYFTAVNARLVSIDTL